MAVAWHWIALNHNVTRLWCLRSTCAVTRESRIGSLVWPSVSVWRCSKYRLHWTMAMETAPLRPEPSSGQRVQVLIDLDSDSLGRRTRSSSQGTTTTHKARPAHRQPQYHQPAA